MERTARSEHAAWLLLVPSALLALSLLLAGCRQATPVDEPKESPRVLPQLAIADVTVSEGDSGTGDAVFNVSLSEAGGEMVTVGFATADGTAIAGTDYQAASGTLTFTVGETALQITVSVIGDIVREPDETFVVTLSDPQNATLADATATGTIATDDDPSAPGQVFRDCAGECPVMVVVPAGSFMMGSPPSEVGSLEDERPVGEVIIGAPFAVGVFEVTFAEWQACVSAGGCGARLPDDGGWGRATRPVIDVDWADAQAYVAWLSQETGQDYRLLTEAEWEYVARAGTTTPFHTGATISTEQANYDGHSTPYGEGQTGEYRGQTIPVGSLARNQFGLYDVHGNVAEWVADCYETDAAGTCLRRVVRGGSWASAPELVRSAYRGWCSPTLRNQVNGFRVARLLAAPVR